MKVYVEIKENGRIIIRDSIVAGVSATEYTLEYTNAQEEEEAYNQLFQQIKTMLSEGA